MIALQIYSHAINEVDGMTGKKDVPHFGSVAHLGNYSARDLMTCIVGTLHATSLQNK